MEIKIINKQNFGDNKNAVIEFLQIFYPDERIEINEIYKTLQNEGSFYCFLLNNNGEALSYCRAVKVWNRKTIFIIRQVETIDEYKGKGCAGMCYKAAEEYISKIFGDVKKIVTFVDYENKSSIRFHEKNGYTLNNKVSKYLKTLYGWDSAYMFEKQIDLQVENKEGNDCGRNNERML